MNNITLWFSIIVVTSMFYILIRVMDKDENEWEWYDG